MEYIKRLLWPPARIWAWSMESQTRSRKRGTDWAQSIISPTPYIAGSYLDGQAPEPMNHKVSLTPLCLAWKQVPEYCTAPAVSLPMKTISSNTVIWPSCSCIVLVWQFCFLLRNRKFQLQPWELLTLLCFLTLTLASPLSVLSFLFSMVEHI